MSSDVNCGLPLSTAPEQPPAPASAPAPVDSTAPAAPPASAAPKRQPLWPRLEEDHPRNWLVYPLLFIIMGLMAVSLYVMNVPAHAGCDQNGYLCTARLLLDHGSLSFKPSHGLQFAGRMMVLTDAGLIYAKYPFGYPVLALIGRAVSGVRGMYFVNPACTVLACLMSFFLFRRVVGRFASLMGVIWLMCNPVTLYWANDAMSHASTLLCVILGFWGLLHWFEDGKAWRGVLGGFALGYACTIRYTEFLLVLPVIFAALARIKFNPRRWREMLPPLIGWAIPIAILAIVCWHAYGRPWLTGYSLCKEQTGFGWEYFWGNPDLTPPRQGNWETLLYQLNHTGLFMLLPVVLAGVIGLFWHSWRLAFLIALWIVPSTVLYMFYYWAPMGEEGVWYLRFFLTVFPGCILAGLWIFERALRMHRLACACSLGVLTALGSSINLANITPQLNVSQESSLSLASMANEVAGIFPPSDAKPNVIFADETACEQLDCNGGYELYSLAMFQSDAFESFRRIARPDPSSKVTAEDPNPLQRGRAEFYMRLLGEDRGNDTWRPKDRSKIDQMMSQIVDDAMTGGRRVAILFRGDPTMNMLAGRGDLKLVRLSTWINPPAPPQPKGGLITRWVRGVEQHPTTPPLTESQRRIQRKAMTWTLYELMKDKKTP